MRYTRKFLKARFKLVASVTKWDVEEGVEPWRRPGHVYLTHTTYSGWAVERITNEHGGAENLVMGCTANELVRWLDGVLVGARDHK